jgi:demethoxyubiquinone hydroxylase (CLK1/Coq7/Cat5 family)
MAIDLERRTAHFVRNLHARESMRLGWYRQLRVKQDRREKVQYLRERKSRHEAFLKDLLRRRGLSPAWYARLFYLAGHCFGFFTAFLPEKWAVKIENTLESWLFLRYKDYLRRMRLDKSMKSMIESVQLKRFDHNEPAPDVLLLLEKIIKEEGELRVGN